jgi:hypothetical protein
VRLKRSIKGMLARLILICLPARVLRDKKYFPLWESKGFHITPVHFYEPIPDTRELKDDLWEKKSELIGVDLNEGMQLSLLQTFSSHFKEEYEKFPKNQTSIPHHFSFENETFTLIDAEILYSMIRHFKPRRIIEIGSGATTCLSAQAIMENKKHDVNFECNLTAIEPYPNDTLKNGFPFFTQLIQDKVQNIPLSRFIELEASDILFIDSSHVLALGSDVQYEFLEILPRIKRGVIVHIHDIFFPFEYPKIWVSELWRFFNEQYLLQAFLAFNPCFEVLWCSSYMEFKYPDKLESAFSKYKRNMYSYKSDVTMPIVQGYSIPSSLWMRRVK